MDKGDYVVIIPVWKSQVWFTKLISLMVHVPVLLPRKANLLHHPLQTDNAHPILSHSHLAACRLSRKSFKVPGFSEDIIDVIIASWRPGTRRQYAVYLWKWAVLCTQLQKDPVSPSPQTVLEFLQTLYNSGLSNSSLSVAGVCIRKYVIRSGKHSINWRTPPYLPIS